MSDEPRQLIERHKEAYNDRDREWIAEHLADPVVVDGKSMAREELLAAYEMYWNAFPDCEVNSHEMVPEGNRVVVRTQFTGTHEGGDYHGIEPTGEAVDVSEMIFYRIEGGRIAEVRYEWDELGFYEQLGIIEHPTEQ